MRNLEASRPSAATFEELQKFLQQETSEGAEVALAVRPDPGLGLQVNVHLISFLQMQNSPVGPIVGEVGVSRVFSCADHDLFIFIEEQEAWFVSVDMGVEGEVVESVQGGGEDSLIRVMFKQTKSANRKVLNQQPIKKGPTCAGIIAATHVSDDFFID